MSENPGYANHKPSCHRFEKNGWIFTHIEGTPFARGYDHGRLMANEIVEAITEAKALIELQTGFSWEFFKNDPISVIHTWKEYLNSEPYKEFMSELAGIAQGVSAECPQAVITADDLIVWNGHEELTNYWFPTVVDKAYAQLSMPNAGHPGRNGRTCNRFYTGAGEHCSAFAATGSYTKGGKIVMAHNSFTPFENSNFMNIIIDMIPSQGNRFIMQACPGYIHSMSDYYETKTGEAQGLMITETTIGGFCAYDPDGAPEFIRIRYAMQYARTLDEFVELFWRNNNGGYANTWLVGDIGTKEIMRFESGLKFMKVDKTRDGYFAGFNAPLDPRIRNLECTDSGFADIRRHQGARQVRIPQLLEMYKGSIDNEIAKRILSDHYDVYLKKENPCSRTICSHYELDDRAFMSQPQRPVPYEPRGAVDGVCSDSDDAAALRLWARWGSSCGMPFKADAFLKKNPQFAHLRPYLKDRISQPWTEIFSNMQEKNRDRIISDECPF